LDDKKIGILSALDSASLTGNEQVTFHINETDTWCKKYSMQIFDVIRQYDEDLKKIQPPEKPLKAAPAPKRQKKENLTKAQLAERDRATFEEDSLRRQEELRNRFMMTLRADERIPSESSNVILR
jgi:hypothetical protein